MPAALAWATHDGLDWLVLRGWPPEAVARLGLLTPDELTRVVRVYPTEVIGPGDGPGPRQSTPGRHRVTDGEIRITPRFGFLAGTSYTMVIADQKIAEICCPIASGTPSTQVVAVYPSGPALPRNALRFYIHFSAKMSEGQATRNVHLERQDTGERLKGVFSPMEPELWDPARRRLTVLLDPARIKQGLAGHREIGYPLLEGVPVVLLVEHGFRDAGGRPLTAEHRQHYEVGPDVRSRINPACWVISEQTVGETRPVVVRFDRPLDRGLLDHCLAVVDAQGQPVPGTEFVADDERTWSFTPAEPWTPGRHRLLIHPVLEDLAGNSVIRIFDRDLQRPDQRPRPAADVAIALVVTGTT